MSPFLHTQVRQLDGAQSRVTATLGHISVVLDRLHAVEGIQTALQVGGLQGGGGGREAIQQGGSSRRPTSTLICWSRLAPAPAAPPLILLLTLAPPWRCRGRITRRLQTVWHAI